MRVIDMNGDSRRAAPRKADGRTTEKEEAEKRNNTIIWIFAIIGVIAAVAGVAYLLYRYFTPDYLEDFDDDFDDDFEDDFFEDDEDEEPVKKAEEEKPATENAATEEDFAE